MGQIYIGRWASFTSVATVEWLIDEGRLSTASPLVAHARTLDSLNLALQLRASKESQTVLDYFRELSSSASLNR